MKILVACEFSGAVRDAFAARGHDAWSCDLLPSLTSGNHIQGDVTELLKEESTWDLMVAHPPCTYLSNSGVRHLKGNPNRWANMMNGAYFFKSLLESNIPKICIENPIMHKYAVEIIGRRQDQIIQPWMFGHPETKATCLWLKGLPKLKETNNVKEHMMTLPKSERSRIHYMSPSKDRGMRRSITYSGIAEAMASQWGGQ